MKTTVHKHQIGRQQNKVESSAFIFVSRERRHRNRSSFMADLHAKVGEKSAFWTLGFPIVILLVLLFGLFEAKMAESALTSFMDPLAEGKVEPLVYNLFGIALALFAIVIGHCFYESAKGKTDEVTGKKTRSWFVLILSLIGLLAYIGFQYYLVQSAGDGESKYQHNAMVVVGVALFEILVGMLLLGRSLTYFLMLMVSIQLWFIQRGLNGAAKSTQKHYRTYEALVSRWNVENPKNHLELEGNHNIRKALIYYNSLQLPDDDGRDESPEDTRSKEGISPVQTQPEQSFERRNEPSDLSEQTIDDVERFLNDDDNLTY